MFRGLASRTLRGCFGTPQTCWRRHPGGVLHTAPSRSPSSSASAAPRSTALTPEPAFGLGDLHALAGAERGRSGCLCRRQRCIQPGRREHVAAFGVVPPRCPGRRSSRRAAARPAHTRRPTRPVRSGRCSVARGQLGHGHHGDHRTGLGASEIVSNDSEAGARRGIGWDSRDPAEFAAALSPARSTWRDRIGRSAAGNLVCHEEEMDCTVGCCRSCRDA
jgi:hypothetical protein